MVVVGHRVYHPDEDLEIKDGLLAAPVGGFFRVHTHSTSSLPANQNHTACEHSKDNRRGFRDSCSGLLRQRLPDKTQECIVSCSPVSVRSCFPSRQHPKRPTHGLTGYLSRVFLDTRRCSWIKARCDAFAVAPVFDLRGGGPNTIVGGVGGITGAGMTTRPLGARGGTAGCSSVTREVTGLRSELLVRLTAPSSEKPLVGIAMKKRPAIAARVSNGFVVINLIGGIVGGTLIADFTRKSQLHKCFGFPDQSQRSGCAWILIG